MAPTYDPTLGISGPKELVVHKFEVQHGDAATIDMPCGAELLHVAAFAHSERVFLWALLDPRAALQVRRVGYFGTGQSIPANFEHVGTATTPDGTFVWHVFAEAVA